jgi:hypothetical protein
MYHEIEASYEFVWRPNEGIFLMRFTVDGERPAPEAIKVCNARSVVIARRGKAG